MKGKKGFEYYYEHLFDVVKLYFAKRDRVRIVKRRSMDSTLTKEQEKAIKEFYKPYAKTNPVFHRYYTSKTGVFCVDYIPHDIYIHIDTYFNDLRAARVVDNKCYYELLFPGVLQPHTVLKRINNIWLDTNDSVVTPSQMKEIVDAEKDGVFVKEAEESMGGIGVMYVESGPAAFDKIKEFADKIKTDIVIQKKIVQHPDMAKINESSVNTLRIYSLLTKEGECKIYSSVVRMGVGKAKVDNFSSGGYCCGIKEDGTLRKYAYSKKAERIDRHPDTDMVFDGYKIPSYEKAVELVKRLHPMHPHFRSVTWDIAIDENAQPVLIEVNLSRSGLDVLQLNNGPLYKEDTKLILDEVFGK